MRSSRRVTMVVLAVVALMAAGASCNSDDETTSSTTTTAAGATDATVNPEYETWCTSVQNLIDQSSPEDLSDLANLAAFTQAMQSLSTNAPEPIESQLQTIATASQARLDAEEQQTDETLPAEIAAQTDQATEDVTTFVRDNCGGLQLPTLDL